MIAPRRAGGFSLVEVTIALGIAVFCLVVIFGLLTVALNTSTISVEQTVATDLLPLVASDLRTAPDPFPKGQAAQVTTVYKLPVPASVATTPATSSPTTLYLDANGQLVPAASSNYQLNVWMTPGVVQPGVGCAATMARVLLTWPANAPLANAAGSVETLVALNRN